MYKLDIVDQATNYWRNGSPHLMRHEGRQRSNFRKETHLAPRTHVRSTPGPYMAWTHFVDVVNNAVNYLPFEWLEHDRTVTRDELRLTTPTQHHAFPDV